MPLSEGDLSVLRSLHDQLSIEEVVETYLPLSRFFLLQVWGKVVILLATLRTVYRAPDKQPLNASTPASNPCSIHDSKDSVPVLKESSKR
jgi:pantothenate kinase